jgi:hypothetical protein
MVGNLCTSAGHYSATARCGLATDVRGRIGKVLACPDREGSMRACAVTGIR